MILFVFEGPREDAIFHAMQSVYFKDKIDQIVSIYEGNIYDLYHTYMKYEGDVDIVSLIKDRCKKHPSIENPFSEDMLVSDFAEVYLFFDYDFHHGDECIDTLNMQLEEMLKVFNNESENGKLYISYPMIEAIRYTKELPDSEYMTYEATREQSKNFKQLSADFSFYKNTRFLQIIDKMPIEEQEKIMQNWEYLKIQNVEKANWICTGRLEMPKVKDESFQSKIFNAQVEKFVKPRCVTSILSAFALFLFDYFA